MGEVHSNTNTALGAAIMAAAAASDLTLAHSPKRPRRQGKQVRRQGTSPAESQKEIIHHGIGWEHPIAEVVISVDEADCRDITDSGPYTSAKLRFDDYRPTALNVRMALKAGQENLALWSIQSGTLIKRIDSGDLPHLFIPITWENGVPNVRQKNEDNCDILLMDDVGRLIQLEVSVTVRSSKNHKTGKVGWAVYLNLQEMFTGQVVRTTKAQAEALGLDYTKTTGGAVATVIPLWGYHAYPGQNWLGMRPSNIWGIETIVPTALDEGRSVQLAQASFEEWAPPELGEPSHEDRQRGVVLFYNAVWNGGSGFIQTADGKSHFMHWSQLRGVDAPQPMTVVEFTPKIYKGKPQAGNVCAVKKL